MAEKKKKPPPFARRLRAARDLRGVSQEELAGRCSLQQPVVSQYESGARRPSFANLRRLADALEVSADYLVGRTKTPGIAASIDDETLASYQRLTLADREIARQLIAQLERRNRHAVRAGSRNSKRSSRGGGPRK